MNKRHTLWIMATVSFFSALLVLFTITPVFSAENNSGRIVDLKGEVQIMQLDGKWETVSSGKLLSEGDTIKTGQTGWAAVLMADETLVQISRNSIFAIRSVARRAGWFGSEKNETGISNSSLYRLDSGKAWMRNKNRNVPVDIETPSVTAAIRGTELNMEVAEDMTTRITVLSGRVGCRNESGSLVAGKKDVIEARPGMVPSRQTVLSTDDAVQWTVTVPVIAISADRPVTDRQTSVADDGDDEKSGEIMNADKERLLGKALFQLEIRENEKARIILEKLTGKFPDYAMGWSVLSLVSLYKGDRNAALKYSEKAVDLKPLSPAPYIIKSYVHQALFDLDSATKSIKTALGIDPHNTLALVNLAKLQFGSDYTDDALDTIKKAENTDPENGEVHSTKGFILLALRKTDEATESFRKAILADSSLGEAYLGYSIVMMRQGETETALEYISAAIALEPRRSMFVSYWGKMLHEIKRFDRALEVLELAAELDPNDPTPELYRAIILNDLDRPTEAIAAVNRSIKLNDNKAVYNSRFILDRDLAVKSVGLAYLYNRLGLSDWGTNKALMSLKQDYTNFAAHMFYGGGFYYDGDKARLYSSEALIGKLLQPATSNTFNSFNNYTSFFEKPTANAALYGEHSSHDTNAGSAIVSGTLPEINTAITASCQKKSSDGWRDSNKYKITGTAGEIKIDPTINDNLSFLGSYYSTIGKYDPHPFDYSYVPDSEEKYKNSATRSEAGYHRHFGPGNDLLLYFKRIDNDNTLWLHDFYDTVQFDNNYPPPDILTANIDFNSTDQWKQPLYQLQGQYHFSAGNHQLTVGGLRYWDDINLNTIYSETIYVIEYGETYTDETNNGSNKVHNTFTSAYIKDIWKITSELIIDSAMYYDVMSYESPYSNLSTDHREVNPRLGIIWQPENNHTVRASVFRYLLPSYSSRIDSTEVAGFPIFRNSDQGDVTVEGDIAYEYDWATGITGADIFYLDKENKYRANNSDYVPVNKTSSGFSKGFKIFINQLVNNGIGLRANYSYKDISNDFKPEANMHDHQIKATIAGIHKDGVSASISQTFRYMDRTGGGLTDEDVWLTDATIGIDFNDKKGGISLMVLNIFNNHFDWTQEAFFTEGGRVPVTQYILGTSLYF